ncbi:MAG: DNA/RNA nuclease SfsA [Clostridia bacterium]|nr:DNA/RNA nuclease SfsA [Clostridia bacterium]
MRYDNICEATFLRRPNRFVAEVELDGHIERVHVKNTGRCAELLVPGNRVWLERSANPDRRTRYDLVAVERADGRFVNMDSMAPNRAAGEWLAAGGLGALQDLRAEVRVGDSRFDFAATQDGRPVYVEVKGCTLEQDGVARFPDAPTERGVKHVRGLAELAKQGCRCVVLIVIQMKGVRIFQPNWATHPAFGEALIDARNAGVEIVAVDCVARPGVVEIDSRIPVRLERRQEI